MPKAHEQIVENQKKRGGGQGGAPNRDHPEDKRDRKRAEADSSHPSSSGVGPAGRRSFVERKDKEHVGGEGGGGGNRGKDTNRRKTGRGERES